MCSSITQFDECVVLPLSPIFFKAFRLNYRIPGKDGSIEVFVYLFEVICVNLGHSLKVDFHWFHQGTPEGKPFHASMDHGDMYILSTKAMGADWEKKGVYSVQHAMGAQKFRQLAKKKQVKKNLLLSRKRGPRRRIARAPQLRPPHPKSKP